MVRQLHRVARLLVVGFACVILTGCSDAGATIAKKWQADLEKLCTTLESIKDAKTCADAIPEVEKIVKDIHASNDQYKKLNLPSEAARELEDKYPTTKYSERLRAASIKLAMMQESNAELKTQVTRLLEIIQNVGTTPEPAKTAPAPEAK